jgi:hypothetical protein
MEPDMDGAFFAGALCFQTYPEFRFDVLRRSAKSRDDEWRENRSFDLVQTEGFFQLEKE